MGLKLKNLLDEKDLKQDDVFHILKQAKEFKEISLREIKKVPTLRGKTVINLFFEASTRTRTSFELAAKRLSADVINISASASSAIKSDTPLDNLYTNIYKETLPTSSVVKGETLLDTLKNLEAMNPDVIVIRHSASGATHFLAKHVESKCALINAGDGQHAHPTQALLDLMTIMECKQESHGANLKGLKVAIIGDIKMSRVARSNIALLNIIGCEVSVCAPASMIPAGVEKLNVKVFYDIKDALKDADVVMMLRIQKERQDAISFPTLREYSRYFSLNEDTIQYAKKDAIVMHPGPMNRGVEISSEIADGKRSVILSQVTNGLALRMALLYILGGGNQQ